MDGTSGSQSSRLSIPKAWPFKRSSSSTSHDRERRKRGQPAHIIVETAPPNLPSPPRSSPLPQTAWNQVPVAYRPQQLCAPPWEMQQSKLRQRIETSSSVRRSIDGSADYPTRRQLELTPPLDRSTGSGLVHNYDTSGAVGLGLQSVPNSAYRLDSVMDISDVVDSNHLGSFDTQSVVQIAAWAPSPVTPITPVAPLQFTPRPQPRERRQTDSVVFTGSDAMLSDVELFAQATAGFLTPEEEILSLAEEAQNEAMMVDYAPAATSHAFEGLVSPVSQLGTPSRRTPMSPIPSSLVPGRLTHSVSSSGHPSRDQHYFEVSPLETPSSAFVSPTRPGRASWPRLESQPSTPLFANPNNNYARDEEHQQQELYNTTPTATSSAYRTFTPPHRGHRARQESIDFIALFPGEEAPKFEEDPPNYAASQAQVAAASRGEATRRAQELQRRWLQSR
ncbi:uncharacterized protein K489DRAFT_369533 [Dissoconium aciculare CBS 342.82]|uniref:Uncharacterized protein n=1 Tax=Dissoconium aciculare CBS 342.82 TaxID=1314786 RepID=A0A6J3M9F4_9PEZI|nr:uncharacterized protein K489DRAFT_369533 [Dissoconium aciculare CBS 342.82]KAF1824681.1 hypothetical protein K489DRAFT_369533 [Dissoconium aciculare CBS 342.82]